ncbi:MAG TPA: class I SAM-dependent methyltransferase [Jiangellaceae bacterium]
MKVPVPPHLRDHPDRRRWNARYRTAAPPKFEPHPFVAEAQRVGFPAGPVLELACGRSGSALALAASGRDMVAVDVSDLALSQLVAEAEHRGLAEKITTVVADVASYRPGSARFALVLATYYWDEDAFTSACTAVLDGGLIGWEALVQRPGAGLESTRPWEIEPGSLSARLPPDFEVIDERAMDVDDKMSTRILARRKISSHGRDGG